MGLKNFLVAVVLTVMMNSTWALTVPFEGFTLVPGATLNADYNFQGEFGDHGMIFCFDNNQQDAVGLIGWNYRGQPQLSSLPILLKNDPQFEGQFADRVGSLFIINTFNTTLIINCVFGF